ncbi:carboxypeptidase Q-like isoform X2 [Odontomachus brunneus]|nr:carboxypeptidase Q-like isoform X2 [Odontomachus brunneus]XP_032667285.1 carboxypeptidase Q-like isoform X2 [Odontomachus brunneus]XP_032667286.1 carboxypeptidase Q-like isoform X2 [Odontomachus brunneus]XP_032667287.1 carboxypeptidase Q-like isoform X2 [Odontomachus brunneus]XP_032667288.1 carboxypeptidase Q-like isoform X2 [Odontomachus brunneus]XP_032667289.1 carboxypeptidase Q-like isoform X2 [Odontomachus brunneus]XP_032667290.1 carboxypeptidase Q-like isoform X2 [Odontomachus brunneu
MQRTEGIIIFAWLLYVQPIAIMNHIVIAQEDTCQLPSALIEEIDSYSGIVQRIIYKTMQGSFKGTTWQDLAQFVDKFGPRFTGTQALEDSIDYVLNNSISLGLENVHGETATVPHWVRGSESATLLQPRRQNLALLGLGYSVGTPEEGITAKAIVVDSFAELEKRAKEIPGKIVVYNQKFVSYGETVEYRSSGATRAAEFGAVAVLIRSVTPYSLYTPHTGMMSYGENVTKIPAACITVEDATLLGRMANRSEDIVINLKMQAQTHPDTQSRNVIADITGYSAPEKIVVVSGHIDSWDVGQGALDDGGGIFISWNAIKLLKQLGLRARRTMRMIMWTSEELGLIGARQYIQKHAAENGNLQFVMESDSGTFVPVGLEVTGDETIKCILRRIMKLLAPLGDMKLKSPCTAPDIQFWVNAGVPGGSLWTQNEEYFYYHHTNADTMLVENPKALDMNTAIFAALSFVLADISVDFPRHNYTYPLDKIWKITFPN